MTDPCVHHYQLPEPSGPTVTGTCIKCGTVREYRIWSDELDRGDYNRPRTIQQMSLGAGRRVYWRRDL